MVESDLKTKQVQEFKETEIGKICTVTSSKRIFQADYVKKGIPFFRSKEIIEKALGETISDLIFISKNKFNEIKEKFGVPRKGDILLSSVGARSGIPYYIKDETEFYFKDGNLLWFKEFDNTIHSQYLFFYLNSEKTLNAFKNIMIGSAQPALTIEQVKKLIIKFPSIEKQIIIVEIISSLTRQIENLQNQNKVLEKIAQTVFKSWFVDFNGQTKFEDSELGEIPKGWKISTLNYLCSRSGNGSTPRRNNDQYWKNGTIPWIKTGELSDGPILDSEEKITNLAVENNICKIWNYGTILVAMYGATAGKIGYLTIPSTFNQACNALIAKKEYGDMFLFFLLKTYQKKLFDSAIGAAQQNLNKDLIAEQEIILPPSKLCLDFQKKTKLIFEQIILNSKKVSLISKIHNSLLPKLMSGEIRV